MKNRHRRLMLLTGLVLALILVMSGCPSWFEDVTNKPPIANAGPDLTGTVDVQITLSGTFSSDPENKVLDYQWSISGPPGANLTIINMYDVLAYFTPNMAGTYVVTLTVSDPNGLSNSDQTQIIISEPDNVNPTANAGNDITGTTGIAVNFDGNGSTDSDGTITTYNWDFGDGATSTGANPSHTYTVANTYTVTLTVTDDRGGTDQASIEVIIGVPNVDPVAVAGGLVYAEAGDPIDFDGSASSDSDGQIVTWVWSFGDGGSLQGEQVTYTYSAVGTFFVTLTVTDNDGGSHTGQTVAFISEATPNQNPVANAGPNQSAVVNNPVTFDGSGSYDNDGTIETYNWTFGDGDTGSGVSTSHTYNTAGTYTVILAVIDNESGIGSDTMTVNVAAEGENQAPVANAGNPVTADEDVEVTFDGSGSSDPDGTIASYEWDFGDDNTGTGSSPSHTYTKAGTYNVTLTVTDNDGSTDSDSTTATINSTAANIAPTADAGNNTSALTGEYIAFSGSKSSDPDGSIVSYQWDFGDESTGDGMGTTHSYNSAGVYTVILTVTDDDGDTDTDSITVTVTAEGENQPPIALAEADLYEVAQLEDIQFTGADSYDPDGDYVTYSWDFGDGNTSDEAEPVHSFAATGTYTVNLTVTDADGDSDTASLEISVVKAIYPPIADAGEDITVLAGEDFTLDGSASIDPDGGKINYYYWTLAPGITAEGPEVIHSYETWGTYEVTLIVVDDESQTSDADTITVTVTELPIADAGGPYSGEVDAAVAFDGSGSYDPDGGSLASYVWDFGDGGEPEESATAGTDHTYTASGYYTVTLTITDDEGHTDTDEAFVSVTGGNTPPVAYADDVYGGVGATVTLDGSGSYDLDGTIVSWEWDFGGGVTQSGETTTTSFEAEGTYQVTLTVMDDSNATGQKTISVYISDTNMAPVANAGGNKYVETTDTVYFNAGSSYDQDGTIVSYVWDFEGMGAPETFTEPSATHVYTAEGTYIATLTVTDDDGDTDSDTVTVYVTPKVYYPPIAEAGGNRGALVNETITFDGGASYDPDGGSIISYEWDFDYDGTFEVSGVTQTHSFTETGTYFVMLRVTDDESETATDTITVSVSAEAEPPIADIGFETIDILLGEEIYNRVQSGDHDRIGTSYRVCRNT